MKKTGSFNPRKFTLTIESWEGESFTIAFDKGPDVWPTVHGLRLDLGNRMFYQDMADEIERFTKKVKNQLQFIATRIDEKGQYAGPYGWGWKDQECDFPPHTSSNPYTEHETGKDPR